MRGHRWRHRRDSPLLGYFRRRLRRRLFAWFGVAILLTGLLSGTAAWVWSGAVQDHEGAFMQFATHRFEAVWDDNDARKALAHTLASDLGFGIRILDSSGQQLDVYGPTCERPYTLDIPDRGEVLACLPESWGPRRIWLPFVVGGMVLWMASGAIAFHLTRPLAQLVRVTREIGKGNLEARMTGRVHGMELRAIAEAVNDMAARIQSMLGAERELLASVSHEIRTPLGHLRILLDTARDSRSDHALVDELDREVEAIDALVGQLLANSRLDFARLDRQPLDAVAVSLRALERANIDPTRLEAVAESLPVHADPALLLQALANLLRNAQEHGGGVAAIKLSRGENSVLIEIEDGGPGFEDLQRAFERGYQGADGKGALGLGLALVRRIAEAHDGTAWAENLESGSRVTLRLPARALP
ncbi:MAG: HAMP domain-containing histidine kinase [Nannocystaceae bacterium]|nr:HAMP domain-containing histidine kinase [Nannocystaceae bacterium]